MLPITKDLLTSKHNRPFLRDQKEYSLRRLKGIIVHWTANTGKGADAKAHVRYFNTTERYASTHYIVDDHSIYQCIPDNEVAYHVGGSSYKADGERIREGSLTPNYFVVGIEMCVNSDGDWNKTYRNAVDLCAHLVRKFQFTVHDIYRHYDMTGKDCPKMMLDAAKWTTFKNDVAKALLDDPPIRIAKGRVNASELNVRKGPGTSFEVLFKLKNNDPVDIYEEKDGWLRIGTSRWVSKTFIVNTFETGLGMIETTTGANIRKTPGTQHPAVDTLPNGIFVNLIDRDGRWYSIDRDRWVHDSLIKVIPTTTGVVSGTNDLNVRFGPGTDYKIVRRLDQGTRLRIISEQNDWLQIGFSEWVYKRFVDVEVV